MPKLEGWEMVVGLIGCLLIGLYAYSRREDIKEYLKPRPTFPPAVQERMDKLYMLTGIRLVSIPDEIYKSMKTSPEESEYLTGEKKSIIALMASGCPYREAFRNAFDSTLKKYDYTRYYRIREIHTGSSIVVSCNGRTRCTQTWIIEHCSTGFCIINPRQHQALIDSSGNALQIPLLMEALKDW